jgi:hypothetical protein
MMKEFPRIAMPPEQAPKKMKRKRATSSYVTVSGLNASIVRFVMAIKFDGISFSDFSYWHT